MRKSTDLSSNKDSDVNEALKAIPPIETDSQTYREYMKELGSVTTYFKDVVTLLLENRPEDPIEFMCNYFNNVIQGSSPRFRSKRYVQLTTPSNRESFLDNLVAAYNSLVKTPGSPQRGGRKNVQNHGLSGSEVISKDEMCELIELVCDDFPREIFDFVIDVLTSGLKKGEGVKFLHFACAVNSCLLYKEFYAKIQQWCSDMDHLKRGRVKYNVVKEHLFTLLDEIELEEKERRRREEEEEEDEGKEMEDRDREGKKSSLGLAPSRKDLGEVLNALKKNVRLDDCVNVKTIVKCLFEITRV